MRGGNWGNRNLLRLLIETAKQPDIAYLSIVDSRGRVVAHNDISRIGTLQPLPPDIDTLSDKTKPRWRVTRQADGRTIFEVYQRFVPSGRALGLGQRFGGRRFVKPPTAIKERPLLPSPRFIFVGLNTRSLEEAERVDIQNMVVTGLILFLAGSAGVVLLFLFQNYQQAKTSLSRVRAFSDSLVENMPIALLALDTHHSVTALNSVAEKILGISSTSVIGRPANEILPAELLSVIDTTRPNYKIMDLEINNDVNAPRVVPLEINGSTIRGEDGNLIGSVILFKDQSEINQLREEIAKSQRLASLGKLAAGVAHEIRNPLSSIKGFATHFKERYKSVPQDVATANIMIDEVDRLDRVVGQLLELSRPIHVTPQQTNLSAFINTSLDLIRRRADRRHVGIKIIPFATDLNISIDRDAFRQVLLNLYLNALEAMEKGGTLTVEVTSSEDLSTVEIHISDTGEGIPEENLNRIFDPYFTTKASGTGLGLSIVHNILNAHRGDIQVTPLHPEGTRFTITLTTTERIA
jgi:two-component system sensor histidine kinase HydH